MRITPHMRRQQESEGKCRQVAAEVGDPGQMARPFRIAGSGRERKRGHSCPRPPSANGAPHTSLGHRPRLPTQQSPQPCRGAPSRTDGTCRKRRGRGHSCPRPRTTNAQSSSHLSSDAAAVWKTPAPFLRPQPAPRAATAFSRLTGSVMECTSVPLRIRPSMPAS